MNFSMDTAWGRAMELIKDNFQLLAIVAAVFLLLPSVAVYLLMPDFVALTEPGADPEVVLAQFQESLVPILMVSGLAMIVQFAGYGALIAMMGGARPTVGEAITTGFKITPSMLAVFVLFFLLYFIAAVVVSLPFALIAGLLGAGALAGVLAVLPILLVSVYLAARMSMSMPVVVLEDTLNPFAAILRSFKLTHKKQWSILIFWTILFVAYMVVALLFTGGFGVIAALAGGGTATALILGVANGALAMAIDNAVLLELGFNGNGSVAENHHVSPLHP
ncbi:MAG: hypothetical protein AAFQ90_13400, partial [Pseudomonadota bacterium]